VLSVVLLRVRGEAVRGESPWDLRPTRGENLATSSLDRERLDVSVCRLLSIEALGAFFLAAGSLF
jgi:hypothetical protein